MKKLFIYIAASMLLSCVASKKKEARQFGDSGYLILATAARENGALRQKKATMLWCIQNGIFLDWDAIDSIYIYQLITWPNK
jgi:diacylglycerol kinase